MGSEARALRFDQSGASRAYVPNISALTESGRGGELHIDVLARTEQTSGASELANTLRKGEIDLLQYLSGMESFPGFKMSLSAPPSATLVARPDRESREKVDSTLHQIENQIIAALEADPVESGYSHPAEAYLEEVIRDYGYYAGNWLIDILASHRWNGSLRADLLRLLSRQKPLIEEWRLHVIQLGLSSSNIELRDAAVQAAESWEDMGAVQLLEAHKEPCPWLADYISRVTRDLMS